MSYFPKFVSVYLYPSMSVPATLNIYYGFRSKERCLYLLQIKYKYIQEKWPVLLLLISKNKLFTLKSQNSSCILAQKLLESRCLITKWP